MPANWNDIYRENKRIIQQAMRDKKLVIFVGAGASIESLVPSWSDAVAEINLHIHPPIDMKDIDLLKIPQFYFNSRCEKEYNELMKEIFSHSDKKPNDVHRQVFSFDSDTIITTNYDDFLERAAAEKGIFPDIIERDDDLPYARSDRMIIKMHGGFTHNNFVLKEDDYLNYSRNFPLIETYIKALFASKVVLFVGYSFNDPDTKQIFNWVKNVLKNNTQHAYLINASSDYNENTDKYFKNMGINILYHQQLRKDNSSSASIYNNTLDFMRYLLSVEKPIEISDRLYSLLAHFNQLNFVDSKDVERALREFEVTINGDAILTRSNVLLDYFQSDHSKDKRFNVIESVFQKANIQQAIMRPTGVPTESLRKTHTFSTRNISTKFNDALNNFDYTYMMNYVNTTDISSDLATDEVKYQVAQGYYELGEYLKCYNVLKKLSGKYRHDRNALWHFITEFNRVHVGRHAISMAIWNQRSDGSGIQAEIEGIDLTALSAEYSGKFNYNFGDIGKRLNGFNFVYSALYNVISSKDKVEEQADKRWLVSDQKIHSLNYNTISFFNFIQLNFLFVDRYSEVKEVFKQYISAAFYAMSKPLDETDGYIVSRNVVLPQLPEDIILFAIRYLNEKELRRLLYKHNIKRLELTDEAMNRMLLTFSNLVLAVKNDTLKLDNREKIFLSLELLSITDLSNERLANVMDAIIELEKAIFFRTDEHKKIHHFIANQYFINKFNGSHIKLVLLVSVIFENIQSRKYGNLDYNPIAYIKPLIACCCATVFEIESSFVLDDVVFDERLFHNVEIAISVYVISSRTKKEQISHKIFEMMETSEVISPKFYRDVVLASIVKPTVEFEEKVYLYFVQKKEEQIPGVTSFPDPVEEMLGHLLDLHYNDYLLEPSKFNSFFIKQSGIWNFLYDMDNFDFSLFELKWLERFGEGVKLKMSENEGVKVKLKELFKKELGKKDIDKSLLEDYLRYFS